MLYVNVKVMNGGAMITQYRIMDRWTTWQAGTAVCANNIRAFKTQDKKNMFNENCIHISSLDITLLFLLKTQYPNNTCFEIQDT